jgi:hypothetical protein
MHSLFFSSLFFIIIVLIHFWGTRRLNGDVTSKCYHGNKKSWSVSSDIYCTERKLVLINKVICGKAGGSRSGKMAALKMKPENNQAISFISFYTSH